MLKPVSPFKEIMPIGLKYDLLNFNLWVDVWTGGWVAVVLGGAESRQGDHVSNTMDDWSVKPWWVK